MVSTTLVWLRNDLRLADNPALHAAVAGGSRVVAIYNHESGDAVRAPGGAARWWLHHSLNALACDLATIGIELIVQAGDSATVLAELTKAVDAGAVYWNRRYAHGERTVDGAIMADLKAQGISVRSFPGNVLVEPWDIATGQGKPYSVFTPFWKSLKTRDIAPPLANPEKVEARARQAVDTDYGQPEWAAKLTQHWTPGEASALQALDDFIDQNLDVYALGRDFPSRNATSRLSPHLRFGEISARQIWNSAMTIGLAHGERMAAVDKFLSELAWRDFSYHQLYHRPDISTVPMQPKFASMDWRQAPDDLTAWQQGRTGFPIVDAGMRELWATGYMQNRVRMLAASLLAKSLLIDWRLGENWFWDCLVDADVASNPASWQWVAGSGHDAAPYFRIFNPVVQGQRFDAEGDYVRRWVPELASLPDKWLQAPFEAPPMVLAGAGVFLGETYPEPIVDLKSSRLRALSALEDVSN